MGTKQLYLIKSCEQILYFNSIKHHIQFQYNCTGWGLGVGHYSQIISSGWPCGMFLALPNFDQPMLFLLSYFGPDPKFYPQFQTRSCTPLSKHDERSYLRKCFRVVCYSKCTSQRGSLKPYSLYTVCISVYISLFQIRKDSYIAYDKLFQAFRW